MDVLNSLPLIVVLLHKFIYLQFIVTMFYKGAECFSLSSSPPSSEEGHITACPHTTVTLTCTATQVGSLLWRDQNGQIDIFLSDEEPSVVQEGPYTLTLVSVENLSMSGLQADLVSTLEVMVDDIDNGTDIECAVFMRMDSRLIYIASPPSPPSNVMAPAIDYQPNKFSIVIFWEAPEYGLVDEYRIEINTTTQTISTNTTKVVVEGEYNIPLEIKISATNCAGSSAEVTEEISVAGCSPPTSPVNGSVGEFNSSRVGAQVTYSCDTDLVLVGERVATCSLPSLQWIPSSEDIMCVQPQEETAAPTPSVVIPSPTNKHSTENSRLPVVIIAVPASVGGGVVLAALILAIILFWRCRHFQFILNMKAQEASNNCHSRKELLARPGSSSGSTALSSPHSPTTISCDTTMTGDTVACYSEVTSFTNGKATMNTPAPSTPAPVYMYTEVKRSIAATVPASGRPDNDAAAVLQYSQAITGTRTLHISNEMATFHQSTEGVSYSMETAVDPSLSQKLPKLYADLSHNKNKERTLAPLSDLSSQPIQYSEIQQQHTSTLPFDRVPQQPPAGEKHPLDEKISVDLVIQQLQDLECNWWAVGEAANIRQDELHHIAAHFKGDDREAFREVMQRVFIPNKTTWRDVAQLCRVAGFNHHSTALLDAYNTGVLPVQLDNELPESLRSPPSVPAPAIPPRGATDSGKPLLLPPPLTNKDTPPRLPPPLADEDTLIFPPPLTIKDTPPFLPPPLADEDTPIFPPPLTIKDTPPLLPPPLAPEDVPHTSSHQNLLPNTDSPPPRPPKPVKPPPRPPRN